MRTGRLSAVVYQTDAGTIREGAQGLILEQLESSCGFAGSTHCQNRMRVIAVIEQAGVIEKILRHKGLRCGSPQVAPSSAPPNAKPTQQEDSPYYASDRMPDCDNVFTD
ncbi:MAG: hypothetical protein WCO60_10440 [Verrucomicrobiota bacterium]